MFIFKSLRFIFFFCFLFVSSLNFGFSSSEIYISEVKFSGDEFVEIYSDSFLNLSNLEVVDESGKNNSLELFRFVNDSNYYLIIGNNFLDNNGQDYIDGLNCSIYLTDKSQVSNGGLKSNGEIFSIGNISFNLSGQKYNFNDDESLSFTNETWRVQSSSVCLSNDLFGNVNNISDALKEDLSEEISCGDYNFEVILKDNKTIFEEVVKFKFEMNYSNQFGDFLVDYWIENYVGDIVKDERESSSLNWKQFTPGGSTAIYQVFGKLKFGNCSLISSKIFTFYSDYVETEVKVKYIENEDDNFNGKEESYIRFLNLNEILNRSSEFLEYEFYRGNDRKYSVNVFLDSKKILNSKINSKFEKVSGKVLILDGFDSLRVVGLGIDERYNFSSLAISNNVNMQKNKLLSKKSSQFFQINNFNLNNNEIRFVINSNINNLTNECYVLRKKTKVSEVGLDLFGNSSLNLFVFDLNNFDELKLVCKYKKFENKNYNYESILFNFTKEFVTESLNSSVEVFSSFDFNDVGDNSEEFIDNLFGDEVLENNYVSSSVKNIDYSSYFVLVGMTLIIIPMILIW